LAAHGGAASDKPAEPWLFSAEKMWSLQRLGEPSIAPDGRFVVLPVTRYDIDANKSLTDLWLVPTDGSAPRQLTTDAAADTQPEISPDGRRVAFVSKRGDDTENQIYVIAVDGGEARRVTNVPTGAELPKWFPDGRRIAFASRIWTDLAQWADQGRRKKEREESKISAKVWDKAPIAHWDKYLDDRELHLFAIAVDAAAGAPAEPQPITRLSGYALPPGDYSRQSYAIAPDGEEIAFVANVDRSGIEPNLDVLTIAACGCRPPRNLTANNPATDDMPSYSPDGRWLLYTRQKIVGFYADQKRLVLHERANGAQRELAPQFDRSADSLAWLPDSRGILAAVDDEATTRIYRYDIGGGPPRAVTRTPSFGSMAVAARSGARQPRVVALRESFSEPPTLVDLDLATGNARKLGAFNDAQLATIKFGKVDSVRYAGARGRPIQMWVVYPPDFDPNKKYPAYMLLHGGPHNAIRDAVQWRWNAHVFAAWGYVVTWHNFHGSSGFGTEFADAINPDRISLPYEDTIKAAEWLREQRWIDADRLAAGGGSYGGFLAATLLGRPHPFKTLIAHAAVYNSFTQIAADYGATKERFFNYWDRPDEFARYSPHTNAGFFTTPTLVIHGQQDLRVPVNHGIELFNVLQKRGVPARFVYFPDENHWIL
ncbi:MAG: S9 family peptidase, partial [Steroidobacteraceae bacterium]|nr:S9 family peptidase [Steroidobacteraceae bacterium]